MKALVVEDDLKSQCLLAKVLAERTHEVTTFENAEQAILEYQKEFYPLIFVDVGLPGMGGVQFCRWIRTQPRGEGTYIIAAVDPEAPDKVQQVLDAGANDFLTKPYQLEQLRARLVIGERQMGQFFEQERLARELKDETDRWTATEEALIRTQQECAAIVNASEEEVVRLREELETVAQVKEAREKLEAELSTQKKDQELLREELASLAKRGEELEKALEDTRLECENSKQRLREAEAALESARATSQTKMEEIECLSSLQELLRKREEELNVVRAELARASEEVARRSLQETDQLAKWSEQMRSSLEDRKNLERELASAHEELVRRGREQVDESLRRADEFHELLEDRRRLERELEIRTNEVAQERKQWTAEREQAERQHLEEVEQAKRLRVLLSGAEEHISTLERDHASVLGELGLHQDARRSMESRWRVLARLSAQLNKVTTAEKAAEVAGQAIHELMGWDSFSADAYMIEGNWVHPLLALERREGESRVVQPKDTGPQPSSLMRRVLEDGAQMITRPVTINGGTGVVVVDRRIRCSTSLMCAPMEIGGRVIGFISLRSGSDRTYTVQDLNVLETVAAQCAAALERIELRSQVDGQVDQEEDPRTEVVTPAKA